MATKTARRLQSEDTGESRRVAALDPMLQAMMSRYPAAGSRPVTSAYLKSRPTP